VIRETSKFAAGARKSPTLFRPEVDRLTGELRFLRFGRNEERHNSKALFGGLTTLRGNGFLGREGAPEVFVH
jgi:hypothetical protein